jgi:hypothetical protein
LACGLLVGSALSAAPSFAQESSPAPAVALGFETMAPVSGQYVGSASPIRDMPGGGLPWVISSAGGTLHSDGELSLSVRGLVLVSSDPVPPNLQGTNPAAAFHAVVSCQTVDASGNPTSWSARTQDVPASPTGDADITETVSLPEPCLAPIVFVAGGSGLGNWFATTGLSQPSDGPQR